VAFAFPPSPTPNQQVTGPNGARFQWNGTVWRGVGGGTIDIPGELASINQTMTQAVAAMEQTINTALTTATGTINTALTNLTQTVSDALAAIIPMRMAASPIMLAAANGTPSLVGTPPQLTRVGNRVTWNFQGNNKATVTGNTISLAEVPVGFRPTGNVSEAIVLPAGNITVQQYTGATTVFPDVPGANQAAGGQRWSVRFSANFAANAAMSADVSWQTNDPLP